MKINYLIAFALITFLGSASADSSVKMRNPVTGKSVTLIGTAHASFFVEESEAEKIRKSMAESDSIYFESPSSLYHPSRFNAYRENSANDSNLIEKIGAAAGICLRAVKNIYPKEAHSTIDAAPILLTALAMETIAPSSSAVEPPEAVETGQDISEQKLLLAANSMRAKTKELESTQDLIRFAKLFSDEEVFNEVNRACIAMQNPDKRRMAKAHYSLARKVLKRGAWDEYHEMDFKYRKNVLGMTDVLYQRLIDVRNKAMLDRLIKGEEFNVTVVVGAAHMGGPAGMINLLHSSGFTRIDQ